MAVFALSWWWAGARKSVSSLIPLTPNLLKPDSNFYSYSTYTGPRTKDIIHIIPSSASEDGDIDEVEDVV